MRGRGTSIGNNIRHSEVNKYSYFLKYAGLPTPILSYLGAGKYDTRIDGINTYATKAYDITGTNDLTQTTESLQPNVSGNIAPTENSCIKNAYNESKLLVHTDIVISGTQTITKIEQNSTTGKFTITQTDVSSGTYNDLQPDGKLGGYFIHSTQLTTAQKLAEYNYLSTLYPPISTTKIDTLEIATSNNEMVGTPQGNVISNITLAATWATSKTLYDDAITAGSTEYEALQAAAMWCYYENDATIGSVYGKLYNGYAAELLKQDIELYNTANPSETWGYHISYDDDWDAIETSINSNTDKLKESSDKYWDDNTGNNLTGMTLLPGGYRDIDGEFYELNETAAYWSEDSSEGLEAIIGMSIRLIKLDTSVTTILTSSEEYLMTEEDNTDNILIIG